jgi:CMP-N-acetylneuraminic acid synthetase
VKILGVIPARGGSKAIPRKNILPLLGKPLIIWTIEAAHASNLIDEFVVSTEDLEIAEVARGAGATVLDRPEGLATDTATTVSVLQHALQEIPADVVVLLQPTSPIRVDDIVDLAIQRFLDTECDSLATGFISHVFEWGSTENVPRQKLQGYFHDDGNVYVFEDSVVKAGRWTGDRLLNMEVPSYYNLEIDTVTDFWANEGILRRVLDGTHRSNDE